MSMIQEVMTTDVKTCTPDDHIVEVAQMMRDENVGAIPVTEEGSLMGMITDRDIVLRCVSNENITAAVREAMSEQMETGTPDMDVDEAANKMAMRQIRRLPVIEQGKLVGIVALKDLAEGQTTVDEASFALSEISESVEVHH
ncbi:CBS domain-containing protein [Salsuginibacillus halophilus]|uniref:CBS domain-containing protein n=1 Tax=Salsuginibacillus halophilus TaxID=517424 RepID=A0A2P8HX66_9BACI|nr:CBS domain-containing protein [Salsuginibacillus halophilus]PSL50819.1 CBS domain-containing protein [Salsuginibacillus halophilus]